jgi:Thrombospondin type 3 repeat/Concanavalin A-like lectin/glucanases superfamily
MLRMATVLCLLALGVLAPASAQGATLVGDYRFDGRLAASDGPGAPLTNLGPGTNTFATEAVDGSNQTVLRFPEGNGVRFTTPAPMTESSVVIQFRFEDMSGWRRIIDVSNRTSDRGLYFRNGQLQPVPLPVSPTRIAPNQWVELALTRNSAGVVNLYLDGAFEATYSDTTTPHFARITDSVNFFVDDLLFPGEMSAGAVARIRVFEGILTGDELDGLPRGPVDADGDGVVDGSDNCPNHANADQADLDGDGRGDVCDEDVDGDGAGNEHDNCRTLANEDQADLDADGRGDACDEDIDGDGVANEDDNAPRDANPDQHDLDEDGIGDVVDPQVLPLTAEMCRHEGWRRFHDGSARFRNQGDCVSFVATRGRNVPAG